MANRPYLDQIEVDGTTYDLREANGTPAIEGYGGNDLSEEFTAAQLHEAIAAGDFSKIRVGDYFPITLSGTFHDYAADADKTMNALMKMEVAAINPYLRFGDTELTAQHVVLCSRDCMPPTLQMRSENSTWYNTAAVNPWLGSALYETLNNSENGIIALLEQTALGPYVFKGPNNKGMRAWLETMAAGGGSPTSAAWSDRGRLFLPTEREVYGAPVWQSSAYAANVLYNQWPIFAGSGRHIIKGAGDGGGRSYWWLEVATSATHFAGVGSYGRASGGTGAADTTVRAPLCFLLT